jgi:hypothetical protein
MTNFAGWYLCYPTRVEVLENAEARRLPNET